jgi:dynein heavy chain
LPPYPFLSFFPGADPTKLIEDLAKRKKVKTLGVSLGQGQEVVARRHVATAAAEGCWVLLQNAHLGLGYLAEVRALLYNVAVRFMYTVDVLLAD